VGSQRLARAITEKLDQGLRTLTARGGTVVLFTPQACFPNGSSSASTDFYTPRAARWFDALLRKTAERSAAKVRIVDFAGLVCPGGTATRTIICDGLHLCPWAGEPVWKWLDSQGVVPISRR
jgi:hypothetical protein